MMMMEPCMLVCQSLCPVVEFSLFSLQMYHLHVRGLFCCAAAVPPNKLKISRKVGAVGDTAAAQEVKK